MKSIAHVVQALTDHNAETTVLSIDGVGAFDLISRRAMMEALHRMATSSSLSSCNSTATLQHICGKTKREWSVRSSRAREGNKVIR